MDSNLNFLYALLVVILIASLALMTRSCGTPAIPPPFDPDISLDEAILQSSQSGRPMVVLFTADWCEVCQRFKRRALGNSRVARWIEANTVPVYIDATRANSGDLELQVLLNKYRVEAVPTLIALEPGKPQDERGRLTGDIHRREVLDWLKRMAPEVAP